MRLSELTNEMLSTYKYPNLMAEVKESTTHGNRACKSADRGSEAVFYP